MDNLIKVFMERNNLAINEEFTTSDGNKYYFNEWFYLIAFSESEKEHIRASQQNLTALLTGECEVVKLPYKPNKGDEYCGVLDNE